MKCSCDLDHWKHLTIGMAGITTMMEALNRDKVPASDQAAKTLLCEFEKLKVVVAEQVLIRMEKQRGQEI